MTVLEDGSEAGPASVASGKLVAIRRHRGRPLSWDGWQQGACFLGPAVMVAVG